MEYKFSFSDGCSRFYRHESTNVVEVRMFKKLVLLKVGGIFQRYTPQPALQAGSPPLLRGQGAGIIAGSIWEARPNVGKTYIKTVQQD